VIEVKELVKRFPGIVALRGVSFSVESGEVVGFLGPNGAGKTTALRILCGYLPATGGSVVVGGTDVFADSLAVRRRIGYLPESTPLYLDMRVDEYLWFRACLKGLPRRKAKVRVGAVKERCGLEHEGRRIIGRLSRGYRQRVGLADAILHEPEVLVLDEPTVGLDPIQARSVRALIKELSEKHTVLLSSHHMAEIEMLCDRVQILKDGRIVASGSPEDLSGAGRETVLIVELKGSDAEMQDQLNSLPHVKEIRATKSDNWTRFELRLSGKIDLRPNVYKLAADREWQLRELCLEKKNLEDAFVDLTNGGGA